MSCTSFLPGVVATAPGRDESAVFAPSVSEWRLGSRTGGRRIGLVPPAQTRQVRAFVHGAGEQLPGLVEEHVIPQDAPFYLAYHDGSRNVIEHWIEQDCDGWQPIELNSGIPHDWSFGALARARSDRGPRIACRWVGIPRPLHICDSPEGSEQGPAIPSSPSHRRTLRSAVLR